MSQTAPSLHRPHAEAPARVARRPSSSPSSPAPDPGFGSLSSERFELVSRGDFVNGRLDGPAESSNDARPLLVLLHDAGGASDAEALAMAAEWARRGLLVGRLDLPLHGERQSPKLSERLVSGCAALSDGDTLDANTRALVEEFARQSVSDVLRTIEALGAESDVDANRVALVGLGLGAQVAAWTVPHAEPLAACVLAGGIGRLADPGLDPTPALAAASFAGSTARSGSGSGSGSKEIAFLVEICATGGRAALADQEALLAALPTSSRRIESPSASVGSLSAGMVEAIDALIDEALL